MELERRLSLALDALGDSPRLLLARARARLELEDGWAAREDVDRAIALGDRDARTRQARARALAMTDELDAALRLADELVAEADPDAPSAVPLRARLRLVAGDVAGALHDLNDLVRYQPDLAWIRRERGIALTIEGRHDDAVAELTRAVALDPTDALAQLWLGLLGATVPADDGAPASRWDVALARALAAGADPLDAAELAVSDADRRACLRHAHAARALAAERAGDLAAARAAWSEVAALAPALDPLPAWARRRLAALPADPPPASA